MPNAKLIALSNLSESDLFVEIIKCLLESTVHTEKVTSPRMPKDSLPIECDHYSSVTERNFCKYDGYSLVERKRTGVKGLADFHWIGFISNEQSSKWTPELQAVGVWL